MQYVTVHGEEIPALGLGTWQLQGDDCRRGVEQAIEIGYRHIDTAQMYGNEGEIGEVVRAGLIDRSELFITTKLGNDNHAPDAVLASVDESLRKLGSPYVDLLLIHWPVEVEHLPATLEAMLKLRDDGKARHLGLSNFTPSQVTEALRHAPIACNQVEYHPFLAQASLAEMARERDFMLTAYSPLARGDALDDPVLNEIGEKVGKNPAQVVLRWLLDQDNVAAVPKATSGEHIASNFQIFDFALTEEDRKRIDELDRDERIIDPPFAPDWER